jgi:hypothetical protein
MQETFSMAVPKSVHQNKKRFESGVEKAMDRGRRFFGHPYDTKGETRKGKGTTDEGKKG